MERPHSAFLIFLAVYPLTFLHAKIEAKTAVRLLTFGLYISLKIWEHLGPLNPQSSKISLKKGINVEVLTVFDKHFCRHIIGIYGTLLFLHQRYRIVSFFSTGTQPCEF